MTAYLSHSGLVAPAATLHKMLGLQYKEFLRRLTLIYKPKIGPPKVMKMYEERTIGGVQCVILPRTLSRVMPSLQILFAPMRCIQPQLCLNLFENQQIIVNHLHQTVYTPARLADGSACAILNLRAGLGKTFVAAGLIERLGLRTLYIVPNNPLANQGCKDLRACFTNDEGAETARVGRWGAKGDRAADDITVIVINSALMQTPEFYSGYSLIIIDEVHMCCSAVRRAIFRLTTHAVLGMSATTENRKDGFDPVAHKELAYDGIIRAEQIEGFTYEDVAFHCTVDAVRYNGAPEFTQNLTHPSTGRLFTPYMIDQFLRDPQRMALAIRKIKELYDWVGPDGQVHNIYVFCEEREPLGAVYQALAERFGDINAPELIGTFIGGIKDQQITDIKANARILLTTYGYSGTGVSIDKMTAIVFLTPRRSNMLQILARILRRGGDQTIERRVVDIIDNRTALRGQHTERKQAYEYYGMEVVYSKVNAEV